MHFDKIIILRPIFKTEASNDTHGLLWTFRATSLLEGKISFIQDVIKY